MSQRKLGIEQEFRTSTTLRVDPKVVLVSKVLQYSQPELEDAIQTELMENPALDRVDTEEDPPTDEEILRTVAPDELRPCGGDHEANRSMPRDSDADPHWTELASSTDSLWDHLRGQLLPIIPQRLWRLAEYLVGSVNERGYLACAIEEAALACNCTLEDAEWVLDTLRDCEPAGVGASDLRECLLLQLRHPENIEEKLARAIVRDCWESLVTRNARVVSRQYRVVPSLVEAAFEVISRLNPFPGESFHIGPGGGEPERAVPARPDICMKLDESGWTVEVRGSSGGNLRVTRTYEERLHELGRMSNPPREEKRHVTEYVGRATRFIGAVDERRQLLARIGAYLIEHQAGFVATGDCKFLRSLTRSRMAQDLSVHESTISRATSGKFVQIGNGEVVPFDLFFKPALRIEKMIEDILQHENPHSPLSDERIAQMLADMGVNVARRTVNKYRDRSRLLSSRRRRTA